MCVQTLFWKKLCSFVLISGTMLYCLEIHLQTVAKMNWWLLPVCSYARILMLREKPVLSIEMSWGRGGKGRKEKGMYVLPCLFFLTGLHDELYF